MESLDGKMWKLLILICVLATTNSQVIVTETEEIVYQIAGIFDSNAYTQRLAFKDSMRVAKLGEAELHAGVEEGTAIRDWRLEPVVLQPKKMDSYSVLQNLCSDKEMRPIAVFGPQNDMTDGIIRDQCTIAEIPHIQATWRPLDPELEVNQQEEAAENETFLYKKISINFMPPAEEILQVYAMLLKYYKWENFAVLYEDDAGLIRVQKILAEFTDQYPITVRKLVPGADNHEVFKDLSEFKEYRIILDCHVDRILKYLDEARNVNMVNYYQHYVLINMDASTITNDLLRFESNVTWLSLTNFEKLNDSKHFLVPRVGWWINENGPILENTRPPVTDMKLEALMMNDIANHVLKALQKLEATGEIEKPNNNICDSKDNPWPYGGMLQNKILNTRTTGVTGNIEFNERGERVNYTLHVNEIFVKRRRTLGKWNSTSNGQIIE